MTVSILNLVKIILRGKSKSTKRNIKGILSKIELSIDSPLHHIFCIMFNYDVNTKINVKLRSDRKFMKILTFK